MARAVRRIVMIAAAATLSLSLAAAIAARPLAGQRYAGSTSQASRSNPSPISFRVSGTGRRVVSLNVFVLGNHGRCSTAVGNASDPPTPQRFAIKVGRTGGFSGLERNPDIGKGRSRGTLTVRGRFRSRRLAQGTLVLDATATDVHPALRCRSGTVRFSARAR